MLSPVRVNLPVLVTVRAADRLRPVASQLIVELRDASEFQVRRRRRLAACVSHPHAACRVGAYTPRPPLQKLP